MNLLLLWKLLNTVRMDSTIFYSPTHIALTTHTGVVTNCFLGPRELFTIPTAVKSVIPLKILKLKREPLPTTSGHEHSRSDKQQPCASIDVRGLYPTFKRSQTA